MNRRHLLLGLAGVPSYYALRYALRNTFVLTNASGQSVHDLTVEVCDTTVRFELLPAGGSVSAQFGTPRNESVFDVRGRYADGQPFADYCGYVVWEDYASTFNLFIRADGMVSTLRA